MNFTKEERDCLIRYSRKSDNLSLALAIGAIQVDLRIAIITEFLEGLRECVKAGLKERTLPLPWYIPPIQIKEKDHKAKGWVPILSIKRKESEREIILYKDEEKWRTYLGGKCHGESALKEEDLKAALVGVGTGGSYNTSDFEWWRHIEGKTTYCNRDLGSDEALTMMNVEQEKKKFIDDYSTVLLKATNAIETLIGGSK